MYNDIADMSTQNFIKSIHQHRDKHDFKQWLLSIMMHCKLSIKLQRTQNMLHFNNYQLIKNKITK